MGHSCRFCGRIRANEKFSGRGHRDHVCHECAQKPRAWRDRVESLDELYGFLDQSNISGRNRERLKILRQHDDEEIRVLAELIEEIARVHPRKRLRVPNLARRHPAIFNRMVALFGDAWRDGFWSDRMDQPDDWLRERWEIAATLRRRSSSA